jgi:hypothetical protein
VTKTPLLDWEPPKNPLFRGDTLDLDRDTPRLTKQMLLVWEVMRDGQWHTLREISEKTGAPEASVSARLRDFRRTEFGPFILDREHLTRGLHQYRLREPDPLGGTNYTGGYIGKPLKLRFREGS